MKLLQMSLTRALFLLTLVFLPNIVSASGSGGNEELVDYYQTAEAQYVIYGLLKSIDEKNYNAAWDASNAVLRQSVSKESWLATVSGMRDMFGAYKSRIEIGRGLADKARNGPQGIYYGVAFKSKFSKMNAEEKIVLSLENGTWKLAGYFLNVMVEK